MDLARRLRRFCFAAAAVLAGSALVAPWSDAADERPDTFASRAAASALEVYFNTVPEQVIPEIFRMAVPDAESQFDASVAKARASTVYPGLLVAEGGALVATAGLPVAPPPFPLTAYADSSLAKDASVATGQTVLAGPATIDAGRADAHADDDKVTADSVNGRIDIAGDSSSAAAALELRTRATAILRGPVAAAAVRPTAADTSLLHVDSSTAETSHTIESGALVVRATSTLNGVRLLGGTIVAEAVVATATSRSDGSTATADRSMRIAGLTVNGEPATLDENGITVGGDAGQGRDGIDQLNTAVKDALGAAGLELRVLSTTKDAQGAVAEAAVEGILLSAKGGDASNGFISHVLFGRAGTSVSASPFDPLDDRGDILAGDTGPLTDLPGGDGAATGGVAFDPVPGPSPGSPSDGAPRVSGGTTEDRGEAGAPLRRIVDVTSDRLETLYVALALAAIGLALGWRRILPSSGPPT